MSSSKHNCLSSQQRHQTGFSLVEMMIVVVIVGILSISALTWGVEYTANNRVRKTGESLQAVLTLARNEAIKSNRAASVTLAGLNWTMETNDPLNTTQRAGSFSDTPNSPTPNMLVTPTPNANLITFNGLGVATSGAQIFAISDPNGTCQPAGKVRCLRVRLLAGGQSSMCDPSLTFPTDPRGCMP